MSDPTEDICDAIVTFLNAAQEEEPNPFGVMEFTASKPADPLGELDSVQHETQVYLVPIAESEEKIGRYKAMEVHQASLWIARSMVESPTRASLSGLVRDIKKVLRGRKMATYTFSLIETASKFDPERLHKGQFFSVLVATYRGIPATEEFELET